MKKRILRFVMHMLSTLILVGTISMLFGLYHGASLHYGDNPKMMDWNDDGPYVFYKDDSIMNVNYIQGNQDDGFYVKQTDHSVTSKISAYCYFPLDSSYFDFVINPSFKIPKDVYSDKNSIIAISDIESGYRTFRDFLINNKVIDKNLNWIFGSGHLVLLGDFVDRDFSTTQVLWFIYKLEQDAQEQGGYVHFIVGNHELKNLQGNYESSAPKYFHIGAILGKQQYQLYDMNSFLGKWLSSKNAIEKINEILFTHGGIHPDLANHNINLSEINQIARKNYRVPYFQKAEKSLTQLLVSTYTGISWYRGYFKDDLTQEEVENTLNKFNAKAVVVGHTLLNKVKRLYNGKVIGIDVKHPKDYHKNFPKAKSQGLLIEGNTYYRVLDNGEKKEI